METDPVQRWVCNIISIQISTYDAKHFWIILCYYSSGLSGKWFCKLTHLQQDESVTELQFYSETLA